ncbi:hypothetical protein N7450_010092 [Penicillium hetheringtonii]|uniref:Xylanolytic transcriptional activator regulatory domain-containing protein n=1 Tax=Penicillium hetheringtonii TaxID=911720 RepID=A0AAD6DDV2_9EURO|nr:hypothetical protein N7450_010092 [Penicillium hetheringtonii]
MTDFLLRIFLEQINRIYEVIHGPTFEAKYAAWWAMQEAKDLSGEPIADEDIDFGILIIRSCLLSLQTLPSPKYPTKGALKTHPEAVEQWLYTLANDLDKSQAPDRKPSIETVQHRFFHTGYSKNYGKIRESWASLSAAVKDAHEMGLHLKDPGIPLDDTEMEVRRRTFWNLYFWDRFMCTFFGHWPLIPEGYFDIEPPHDNLQPYVTSPYILTPFTDHIFHIKIARYITAFLSPPSWTSDQYAPMTVSEFAQRFDEVITDQLPPPLWMENPDTSWDIVDPSLIIKRLRLQLLINSTKSSLYRAFTDPCGSLQPNKSSEIKGSIDPIALSHRRSLIQTTSNMISLITRLYTLVDNEGGGPPAERMFLLPIYLVDALTSLGVSLLSVKFDERRFFMGGMQTIVHPDLQTNYSLFIEGFDLLCRQASLYSLARRGWIF